MKEYKKMIVLVSLSALLIISTTASRPPEEEEHYTNLKVLPKNTSEEEMERIMYAFDRGLGVNCVYCHVNKKNVFPPRADFASDEKPAKRIAREMLRMSIKINKKYFDAKNSLEAIRYPKVWCKTCHRGFPIPSVMKHP